MQKKTTHTHTVHISGKNLRFYLHLICLAFLRCLFFVSIWICGLCVCCIGVRCIFREFSYSLPEGHWPCGEGLRFYFTHMWLSWAPSSEDKRAPRYMFTVHCSHIHTHTCTHICCAYIERWKLDINKAYCKWLHANTERFSQCNCCPCSNVSVCHGLSIIEFHYTECEAAVLPVQNIHALPSLLLLLFPFKYQINQQFDWYGVHCSKTKYTVEKCTASENQSIDLIRPVVRCTFVSELLFWIRTNSLSQ